MKGRLTVTASIGADLLIVGPLPDAIYATDYSATLRQYGGVGTLKYNAVTGLPTGITATDNGDGSITIAGNSTASGSYVVTISGRDAARTPVTRMYAMEVQVLPLTITGDLVGGVEGTAASGGYVASGGVAPYTFSVFSGTFPSTGGIGGATGNAQGDWKPDDAYAWRVKVRDAVGTIAYLDDDCTTTAALALSGTFAGPLYDGVAYSQAIAISGGGGGYTNPQVASGALPSGLALSIVGTNLVLSGTPNAGTTFNFTVSVDDALGETAESAAQSLTRQDEHFALVTALFPMDGADLSTTITNLGSSGAWGRVGNTSLRTANKKYGSASCYFDGNGDYLSHGYTSDFDFSTRDFTIEGWLYRTGNTGNELYAGVFTKRLDGTHHDVNIFMATNTINIYIGDSGSSARGAGFGTVPLNTWTHFSVSRVGSNIYLHVNGVLGATMAITGNIQNHGLNSYIGRANPSWSDNQWLGYMDDYRITMGVGRYGAANYTPPVDAFPVS